MNATLAERIDKLSATIEKMKNAGADPADYADLVEMLDAYRRTAITEHRAGFPDTDRCVCGGVVVSFDDGDANGEHGEGCEVSGRVFVHRVVCDYCGERHVAEESHVTETQGQIYAVVCTDGPDGFTDYYTAERLV